MNQTSRFDEFLSCLQSADIKQTLHLSDWEEDLPPQIHTEFKDVIEGLKLVESEFEPLKHRWYEESDNIYEFEGRFLGVNGISHMFSENSSIYDMRMAYCFYEAVVKTTTTYVEKTLA